MVTYYVLITDGGQMVAAGRGITFTYNVSHAKHFTSEWSANSFRERMPDGDLYRVKKIQRF